ncbi:hypothetical protein OAD33_03655 [Alphaproteobacteria bacterium]|nr:hypothetical protein [Alphaproteobacteria bacterium]
MFKKNTLLTDYRNLIKNHENEFKDLTPRKIGQISNLIHNEFRDFNYKKIVKNRGTLEDFLMNYYCYVISMIESRQTIIEYNDIEFSRRIGEVWEGLCQLIITNPNSTLKKVNPLDTSNFYNEIKKKIIEFSSQEKINESNTFHNFLVELLGDINLKLDFNGCDNSGKLIGIDFKSGFGSNEKGNTQRILQVGKIYKFLTENIELSIIVRQNDNNNYYDKIKNSGVWNAIKGNSSYDYLSDISGCNAINFLKNEFNFTLDFKKDIYDSIGNSVESRDKYLTWYT